MSGPRTTRALLDRPGDAADLREAAERRQAMRALLATPLLHAGGPQETDRNAQDLLLVRRHREAVTAEFANGLRYRLIVEPAGARLVKTGLGPDGSRPLRRPARGGVAGRAFTPRGYALLMVTLAVLMRVRSQLMLAELVGEIRSAAADVDIAIDLDSAVDRRLLHTVLLVLIDFGVVLEQDGDLEHWAENSAAQSLLEVSMERLGLLLAVPMPTGISTTDILNPAPLSSGAGGARIATRRMLAESPLLTTEDLDPEYREWWARTRFQQVDWFDRVLGLRLELRAEGALAIDPDEELSDEQFPGTGTVRHAALLVLVELSAEIRERSRTSTGRSSAWWAVSDEALQGCVDAVVAEHRKGFRKEYREDPVALRVEIIALLGRMGLLRAAGSDWFVHAAAGRYAVTVQTTTDRPGKSAGPGLFDATDGQGE